MTRPSQKAFTLIELLVVIAIISLLISVLLPSLKNARELARSAKCVTNLRLYGTAIYQYVGENNGILPRSYDPRVYPHAWEYHLAYRYGPGSGGIKGDSTRWTKMSPQYDLTVCPSDPASSKGNNWTVADNWGKFTSYVANAFVLPEHTDSPSAQPIDRFRRPAEHLVVTEKPGLLSNSSAIAVAQWRSIDQAWKHLEFRHRGGQLEKLQGDQRLTSDVWPAGPKNSTANTLMLDGHVEAITRQRMRDEIYIKSGLPTHRGFKDPANKSVMWPIPPQ